MSIDALSLALAERFAEAKDTVIYKTENRVKLSSYELELELDITQPNVDIMTTLAGHKPSIKVAIKGYVSDAIAESGSLSSAKTALMLYEIIYEIERIQEQQQSVGAYERLREVLGQ